MILIISIFLIATSCICELYIVLQSTVIEVSAICAILPLIDTDLYSNDTISLDDLAKDLGINE